MSNSVVSGTTIRYAIIGDDGEVHAVSTNNANLDLQFSGIGEHKVWGLVGQDDGCGDAVAATAWVGLDDGTPVGPVPVSLSDATATNGVDTVDVVVDGVTDCTGSFAAGAMLNVRANMGEIAGAASSGNGLVVTLGNKRRRDHSVERAQHAHKWSGRLVIVG